MANYGVLRYGTTSEDVKKLQEALNEAGGYALDTDGIYGEKTRAAVTDYQQKNGLAVDGIAGSETLGHLYTPKVTVPEQPREATAWEKWVNREAFSYDPGEDPLYEVYKQQYLSLGRLAMEDAVGKAAALTGGYGNSYAQTAGQQAYQGYMQQLSGVIPELENRAYSRYTAEGKEMYDQAVAYDKQRKEAYEQLKELLEAGYSPTEAELKAAGITRQQAQALQSSKTAAAKKSSSTKTYSTRGYSVEEVKQLQKNAGITVDGIWGRQTEDAYQAGYRKDGSLRTREFVKNLIPESQHDTIQRKLYGSYRNYIRSSILNDKTLTQQDKNYLLSAYGLTG